MRAKSISIAVFAATLAPAPAFGGPWVPGDGHGYLKLGGRALISSRYIDGKGTTFDVHGYREVTMLSYLELGLGAGFAATLHGDVFRWINVSHGEGRAAQGALRPGDPELGLRWQFFASGPWAAAAEVGARFPIASSDPWTDVESTSGQPVAEVRFGSGELDVRAAASFGWATRGLDTSISLGWLARTGGYDHALRWSVEAGGEWWVLFGRLRLGGQHRIDTGGAPLQESISGIGNGTSYTSTIFELGGKVGDGVALGMTSELSLFGLGLERQARGLVLSAFVAWAW